MRTGSRCLKRRIDQGVVSGSLFFFSFQRLHVVLSRLGRRPWVSRQREPDSGSRFGLGGCICFHAACIMCNVYPLLYGDLRYNLFSAQRQWNSRNGSVSLACFMRWTPISSTSDMKQHLQQGYHTARNPSLLWGTQQQTYRQKAPTRSPRNIKIPTPHPQPRPSCSPAASSSVTCPPSPSGARRCPSSCKATP